MFNNRELATAVWLLLLAVWALTKPDIRKSAGHLLRTFFQTKILAWVGAMIVYTACAAAVLALIGMWDVGLTKDTILWFCLSGFALVLEYVASDRADNLFRRILLDNIKVIIILEFLVNTYTFSFLGELVFVPCVTFVTVIDAVARTDHKYAPVVPFTGGLLVVIGLSVIAFAISGAISDYRTLGSLDTVRSILLVPALSLTLAPFIYLLLLVVTYETVFVRLNLGAEKPSDVMRYARRRILSRFRLRVNTLRAFLRDHALDLMRIRTTADVDDLLGVSNPNPPQNAI